MSAHVESLSSERPVRASMRRVPVSSWGIGEWLAHGSGVGAEAAIGEVLQPEKPEAGTGSIERGGGGLKSIGIFSGNENREAHREVGRHLDERRHLVTGTAPERRSRSDDGADPGEPERRQPLQRRHHLLGGDDGHEGTDRLGHHSHRGSTEDAGRHPGAITVEGTAGRVGGRGCHAGNLESRRGGNGEVTAHPVEQHGPSRSDPVEVVPGGQPPFRQRLVVQTASQDRCAGWQFGRRRRDATRHARRSRRSRPTSTRIPRGHMPRGGSGHRPDRG